jgi:predicted enzyme related to lactoylglutathione lyase
VDSARTFYQELLGEDFWGDGIEVGPLPPQAAARGAPPHWLGHVAVDDVVDALHRCIQSGATPLGAMPQGAAASGAIIRDRFGALVGMTSEDRLRRAERVAWRLLSVRDEIEALTSYSALFGWVSRESLDLGPQRGRHVTFAWDRTGVAAGSVANIARLPHVHPQWLFFFRTENLERSLDVVRALDGLTLQQTESAAGDPVAPCDDPQGAAFALYQPRGRE